MAYNALVRRGLSGTPGEDYWYNDWGTFWDDISNIGTQAIRGGTAVRNTAANAANPSAFRVDLSTVLLGGAALVGGMYLLRRRNPRGRRVRRRRR